MLLQHLRGGKIGEQPGLSGRRANGNLRTRRGNRVVAGSTRQHAAQGRPATDPQNREGTHLQPRLAARGRVLRRRHQNQLGRRGTAPGLSETVAGHRPDPAREQRARGSTEDRGQLQQPGRVVLQEAGGDPPGAGAVELVEVGQQLEGCVQRTGDRPLAPGTQLPRQGVERNER